MQGSGDASEGDVQEKDEITACGEENERGISYGTRLGQKRGSAYGEATRTATSEHSAHVEGRT